MVVSDCIVKNGILTQYCGDGGEVAVPDGVTSISEKAFSECKGVTSVIIPEGVETIGEYAFKECTDLISVKLPNSVTSIGKGAFDYCIKLQTINLPEGLTYINEGVFSKCSDLQSITIPKSVIGIGDFAFYRCGLTSLIIPEGTLSIGWLTFASCKKLQSVSLSEGITSIGIGAFSQCESLLSITIPKSIKKIEKDTFSGCASLRSIELHDGIRSIGVETFRWCKSLKSIEIPTGIRSIGAEMFERCDALESVTVPATVKSIGKRAFYNCTSLKSITLPTNTKIAEEAFKGCDVDIKREDIAAESKPKKKSASEDSVPANNYTDTERECVKAYILEQYAKESDIVEIITDANRAISIVKITSGDHITYVTLGAGAYSVENCHRKDFQNFELAMVASSSITEEQEKFIIQNLPYPIIRRSERKNALNEMSVCYWVEDEESAPFEYGAMMLLRSADPLDIKKLHVNFMVALPLKQAEVDALIHAIQNGFHFVHMPFEIIQRSTGDFFKSLTNIHNGKELLYIDACRQISPYPDVKKLYIKWPITLTNARKIGYAFWQELRDRLPVPEKKVNVKKLFKYEYCEGGVMITSYIGTDLEVVIPEEIDGSSVVKIKKDAFSAMTSIPAYSRTKETRGMITKVTFLGPINEIHHEAFSGCVCLKEVIFGKKVCIDKYNPYTIGDFCNKDFVLYRVEKDSWAEKMCQANDFNYEIIELTE